MNPDQLPIYKVEQEFLQRLSEHQVVVLESPTGSGKTTQLPLILHRAGYTKQGRVAVTQPRRLATVSVCQYIRSHVSADQQGLVGYKIRFAEDIGPATRLQVMTDGILLQEMKSDELLSDYSVIMVDEAHERSLNIDLLLGLLKRMLPKRPDLKVIISSATINTAVFAQHFNKAPVISLHCKQFPVRVVYHPVSSSLKPNEFAQKLVDLVEHALSEEEDRGDLLVFVPGVREIYDLMRGLEHSPVATDCLLLPLYARLSRDEQMKIFQPPPPGKTKVVIATNIAETSVTIDGVTVVIDSGLARLNAYDPETHAFSLDTVPISKASCVQRMGRAGRTQPGLCYRLYGRQDLRIRPAYTVEEIKRTELSEVVLRMADLNIADFTTFPFLAPPSRMALQAAVQTLQRLGALDQQEKITPLGKKMSTFPLLPRHSRIILEAMMYHPEVIVQTCILCAFFSTNPPWLLLPDQEAEVRAAHQKFWQHSERYGDFACLLNLYRRYSKSRDQEGFCQRHYLDDRVLSEVSSIVKQLCELVAQMGVPVEGGTIMNDTVLRCCLRGFIQNVCVRTTPMSFRSATLMGVAVHPGSSLFKRDLTLFVSAELICTSRNFARMISPLPVNLLKQVDPDLLATLTEKRSSMAEERNRPIPKTKAARSFEEMLKSSILDWNEVHARRHDFTRRWSQLPSSRVGLRLGKNVLLRRKPMKDIVEIAILLDPESILSQVPKQELTLGHPSALEGFLPLLDWLLYPVLSTSCIRKPHLGFVGLATNDCGVYWFYQDARFAEVRKRSMEVFKQFSRELSLSHASNSRSVSQLVLVEQKMETLSRRFCLRVDR